MAEKKSNRIQREMIAGAKKHWNAIMDIIGLSEPTDVKEVKNDGHAWQKTIAELENKVRILEHENARLNAMPTMTEPAEDPHPTEVVLSSNRLSYNNDIRNIISK